MNSPNFRGNYGRRSGSISHGSPSRSTYSTAPTEWASQTKLVNPAKTRAEFKKMPAGTTGKQQHLIANFFQFKTRPITVFHYDLEICKAKKAEFGPESEVNELADKLAKSSAASNKPKASALDYYLHRISPIVIEEFTSSSELFKDIPVVHDNHKNLYTAKKLAITKNETVLQVNIDGQVNEFIVQIQEVATNAQIQLGEVNQYYDRQQKVDKVSEKVIATYDIILKHLIGKDEHLLSNGQHFYDLKETHASSDLPEYLQVINGFTTSARLTEFGLALNVHLKTTVRLVNYENVEQLIKVFFSKNAHFKLEAMQPSELKSLNRIIKSLRIRVNHLKDNKTGRPISRIYEVAELIGLTPFDYEIILPDKNSTMLMAEYYRTTHKVNNLRRLPVLKTVGKNGPAFPLELCELIPNQFLADTESDQCIKDVLIKVSNRSPDVYFNFIKEKVERINVLEAKHHLLSGFGITSLSSLPVRVPARILPLPSLKNKCIKTKDGKTFTEKFYEVGNAGKTVMNWAVVSLNESTAEHRRHLDAFVELMIDTSKGAKLFFNKYSNNSNIQMIGSDVRNVYNEFAALKSKACQFVFVVPPNSTHQNKDLYKVTKYYLDVYLSLPNQCINAAKLVKIHQFGKGYINNVLLKVNAKLGGKNRVCDPLYLAGLPFNTKETMHIGLDVNHPGSLDRVPCSIAAAVGFVDGPRECHMVEFRAATTVQRRERDETINDLKPMIIQLLTDYQEHNRKWPRSLIVWRDGVSEFQFPVILQNELQQMRAAIAAKTGNANSMKITIIVVQKRHHTRFSLLNRDRGYFNVPSGTVVDTSIVEPNFDGFILSSHFSPLGTTRPTKYITIHDDHKMTADQLQRLCFYACFNAQQTESTLSIPTPVFVADMSAYRAKDIFDGSGIVEGYRFLPPKPRNNQASGIEDQEVARITEKISVPAVTRKRPYCL